MLIPARVLGLPWSIEIDQRPERKLRQGFIGAPAEAGGGGSKKKQHVLLFAHSPEDGEGRGLQECPVSRG